MNHTNERTSSAPVERRLEKYDPADTTLPAAMDRVEVFVYNNGVMPSYPSRPLPPEAKWKTKFSEINRAELLVILNDLLTAPLRAEQEIPTLKTELSRREALLVPERQFLGVLQTRLKKAEERRTELEAAVNKSVHSIASPQQFREMLAEKRDLEEEMTSIWGNVVRGVWQRFRLAYLNSQGLSLEDVCHARFVIREGHIHPQYIEGSAPYRLEKHTRELEIKTEETTQHVEELQAAVSLLRRFLAQVKAGIYTPFEE